jgi:hypothetical protein
MENRTQRRTEYGTVTCGVPHQSAPPPPPADGPAPPPSPGCFFGSLKSHSLCHGIWMRRSAPSLPPTAPSASCPPTQALAAPPPRLLARTLQTPPRRLAASGSARPSAAAATTPTLTSCPPAVCCGQELFEPPRRSARCARPRRRRRHARAPSQPCCVALGRPGSSPCLGTAATRRQCSSAQCTVHGGPPAARGGRSTAAQSKLPTRRAQGSAFGVGRLGSKLSQRKPPLTRSSLTPPATRVLRAPRALPALLRLCPLRGSAPATSVPRCAQPHQLRVGAALAHTRSAARRSVRLSRGATPRTAVPTPLSRRASSVEAEEVVRGGGHLGALGRATAARRVATLACHVAARTRDPWRRVSDA